MLARGKAPDIVIGYQFCNWNSKYGFATGRVNMDHWGWQDMAEELIKLLEEVRYMEDMVDQVTAKMLRLR